MEQGPQRAFHHFYNGFSPGKVDLVLNLPNMGDASPLPVYEEPPESPVSAPELYKEFPLVLTTGGRNVVYYHSAHRNIPSLRKISPDPCLEIHPDTAAQYGVMEDEWVFLETPRGRVEVKIRLDENIHPRVVHAPHGYWYGVDNGWRQVNINIITNNEPWCPVTGSVQTRALLCRVKKMTDLGTDE